MLGRKIGHLILVDDGSKDDTVAVARSLEGVQVHVHDKNKGYGGNQKTCYRLALEAGADIVKVFPATSLGPSFFKDIRGPLPQLRLMPTGGVTRENAGDWIRAGAVAIGAGSALVDSKAVAEGRLDVITANARHFIEAVRRARVSEAGG